MLTCLNLLCHKMQRLLVVERSSRKLQRMWVDRLWENNWVKGAADGLELGGKRLREKSFQQNLQNKSVGGKETFLQTFLVDDHVKQQFSVPIFCGSVWRSWRESPNCWRCPVVAWTRILSNYLSWWKLHRVWILNASELLRWFETVFFGLEAQICHRRGYDTYESEGKKEHKDESVVFTETGYDVEGEEVGRVLYVNNILHSIFSIVEMYINNQQIYSPNGLYAHKSYISNNFKAAISEYKGVLHCEVYDFEQDPEDNNNPLPDHFFTKRMKLLNRPDGSMLYSKLGSDFFTTSELLYPNMKIRLRQIKARPNFYMISDNPNVSLGIVDCSLYTCRIALKDDYHKKRMDMLTYAPVD